MFVMQNISNILNLLYSINVQSAHNFRRSALMPCERLVKSFSLIQILLCLLYFQICSWNRSTKKPTPKSALILHTRRKIIPRKPPRNAGATRNLRMPSAPPRLLPIRKHSLLNLRPKPTHKAEEVTEAKNSRIYSIETFFHCIAAKHKVFYVIWMCDYGGKYKPILEKYYWNVFCSRWGWMKNKNAALMKP